MRASSPTVLVIDVVILVNVPRTGVHNYCYLYFVTEFLPFRYRIGLMLALASRCFILEGQVS